MDASKQAIKSIDNDVTLAKSENETVTCSSPPASISRVLEKFAGAGATIQVPVEFLTSLLTSVDNLKKEMSVMQRNIETLQIQKRELDNNLTVTRTDLQNLQKNSGVGFYLFPKLPLELQLLIWREALRVPRVIALQCYYERHGVQLIAMVKPRLPNPIREVCKDGRSEALKVQTSTFPAAWPEDDRGISRKDPNKYVLRSNSYADILWFFRWAEDSEWEDGDIYQIANRLTEMNCRPRTIAISLDQWLSQLQRGEVDRAMHDYGRIQTRELIIVLTKNYLELDECSESIDVVFIEPPQESISSASSSQYLAWRENVNDNEERLDWKDGDDQTLTWKQLEEEAMQYLELEKSKHARRREDLLKAGSSEDAIDGDTAHTDAWDSSTWTVKNIRFMNATTMTQLREDETISTWSREDLRSKIIPPQ